MKKEFLASEFKVGNNVTVDDSNRRGVVIEKGKKYIKIKLEFSTLRMDYDDENLEAKHLKIKLII